LCAFVDKAQMLFPTSIDFMNTLLMSSHTNLSDSFFIASEGHTGYDNNKSNKRACCKIVLKYFNQTANIVSPLASSLFFSPTPLCREIDKNLSLMMKFFEEEKDIVLSAIL